MKTTITVRLDERRHQALKAAAKQLRQSASEIIRDALDRALSQEPVGARAGHVKGRLHVSRRGGGAWRAALRQRNWRS